MVAPICALPPLSDSLCESESHLNVRCRTLLFVVGACRATGGYAGSYTWAVTQLGDLRKLETSKSIDRFTPTNHCSRKQITLVNF